MRRAALVGALALLGCLALSPGAEAGRKAKGGSSQPRVFSSGPVANLPIPDALGVPPFTDGVLNTTIDVRGLRGRRIDDVNLSLRASHAFIGDLTVRLTAPNGATIFPVTFASDTSYGAGSTDCNGTFLTLDDETPVELGSSVTVQGLPELLPPYAGVARPGGKPLAVMDGGPVNGTWALSIRDFDSSNVGTLHCWQVQVTVTAKAKKGKRK